MKNSKLIPILLTSAFLTSCGVGSVDCGANSAVFGLAFCETGKPNKWDSYVGTFTQCRPLWEISGNYRPGFKEFKEIIEQTIILFLCLDESSNNFIYIRNATIVFDLFKS